MAEFRRATDELKEEFRQVEEEIDVPSDLSSTDDEPSPEKEVEAGAESASPSTDLSQESGKKPG
jgi:hypothetical protein